MEDTSQPLHWLPLQETMSDKEFKAFIFEFAARLSLIFDIPVSSLGLENTMKENLYSLPEAARRMGISARTLYRYMERDVKQPEKLKIFPGVTRIEHKNPGKKENTNYFFTSSDIRSFNRKYGKPEEREGRIKITYGGSAQ